MARTVGGRCDITLDGVVHHPVAEIKLQEANFEVEVVDNQDGTIGRSVKSSHFEAEITFRTMAGLDIGLLMARSFDFSMVERDLNRSILLTDAFLVGKPSRNTVNGEISGLRIVSEQYRVA